MQTFKKYSVLSVLLLISLLLPHFITDYWIYVLTVAFYYAIMAAGWNLLGGYTGQFSLCHSTFALIGAYASALTIVKLGLPFWMGILSGTLLTLVLSLGLGIVCLRVRGIYLALITWAFAEVIRTFIRVAYEFTGGDRGLNSPYLFRSVKPLPYYYLFLGLTVLAIILIAVVMRSRIGFYLRAIRNDEVAARAMGVNTVRWKIFAFMLPSGLAGVTGAFYGHYIGLISPVLGEFNEMAMILIFVVIGGMRTQAGPIAGAITVRLLMEFLREWAQIRIVILSAIVILVMRFFNGGLMEFLRRARGWVQKKEAVSAYASMGKK